MEQEEQGFKSTEHRIVVVDCIIKESVGSRVADVCSVIAIVDLHGTITAKTIMARATIDGQMSFAWEIAKTIVVIAITTVDYSTAFT